MSQEEDAQRLRIATRTFQGLIAIMVVAFAAPLFLHYTGFAPAKKFPGHPYPKIEKYQLRLTPGQGVNHGIDFSQIWLSAQKLSAGQKVYYPVEKTTWRREWSSTYHPLIHWLYIPVGKLPFQTGLILHNLFGIALMLGCSALALRQAGCLAAFPSTAAVILSAMYLTPTGLLHVERGQMDTYVAASMLSMVAFFASGGRGWAIATGILSTLKVQAWVFVGFYALVAAPLFGLRDKNIWWVPATIAAVSLVFGGQIFEWVPSFLYVADNVSTHGAPFIRVIPRLAAFTLPLATSVVVGLACFLGLRGAARLTDVETRHSLLMRISFPFAAAIAIQTVCGTTVTHDYRLVAFLGLMPALCVWCVRATEVSMWLRRATAVLYALALLVALRIPPFVTISYENVAYLLLTASLLFASAAAYLGSDSDSIAAPAASDAT
jgi:hypothetical protein